MSGGPEPGRLGREARRLFSRAVELPEGERAAWLDREVDDPALRRRVEELLAADAAPARILEAAPEELAALVETGDDAGPTSDLRGQTLGPYRILDRVGEGGMGVVYRAERADLEKEVALKVVRGALGDPGRVRRFLAERRLLAALEHPGIARFLDAGIAPDETPYLVMEFVEGVPVTEHARSNRLSIGDRIRLLREVCDAVSHAHARLVVHRDLKPSNVLVTPEGRTKLLDFGIAKLLADDGAEETGLTRTGVRVLSPRYAAPEQVAGDAVSTATDVYALGVLLRELLPGGADGGEGADPREDARRLPGDLRAILTRALEEEPERRYGSARELADDLGRYLEGRPVVARMPTLRYRAGKFLRRNAWAVGAAVALVLSLSTGLGMALWQARRAEAARAEADAARVAAEAALERSTAVQDFLTDLFQAADPRETLGEEITARELLGRGVERIDGLEGQPALQAEIGDVLAVVHRQLGDYGTARDLSAASAERRRSLPPGEPAGSDSALAVALNQLAMSQYLTGWPDSAASSWRRSLELARSALGPSHDQVLAVMGNLASAYGRLGRSAEAEALLRETVALERDLLEADDPDRAFALSKLGLQLALRGAYAEAEGLLREAHGIARSALGPDHPNSTAIAENLGMLLRESGRYDEAEAVLRPNLSTRVRVLGEDHRHVAASRYSLGLTLALRGRAADVAEAETLLIRSLEGFRSALGEEHSSLGYPLHALGVLAERRGDLEAAEAWLRRAVELRESLGRDDPAETVRSLTALARVERRAGSPGAAATAARARELAATLPEGHVRRAEAEALVPAGG